MLKVYKDNKDMAGFKEVSTITPLCGYWNWMETRWEWTGSRSRYCHISQWSPRSSCQLHQFLRSFLIQTPSSQEQYHTMKIQVLFLKIFLITINLLITQVALVSSLISMMLSLPSPDPNPEAEARANIGAGHIALDSTYILPLLLAGAAFAKVTI